MILLLVQQEECDDQKESSNTKQYRIYAGPEIFDFDPLIDRDELFLELFGIEIFLIIPKENGQEDWPTHKDKYHHKSADRI